MKNYEKAYKDALERARMYWDNDNIIPIRSFAEYIFPELTLRKDEIVRMALVKYFDEMRKDGICANGIHPSDIIEWLKRQKRGYHENERVQNHC